MGGGQSRPGLGEAPQEALHRPLRGQDRRVPCRAPVRVKQSDASRTPASTRLGPVQGPRAHCPWAPTWSEPHQSQTSQVCGNRACLSRQRVRASSGDEGHSQPTPQPSRSWYQPEGRGGSGLLDPEPAGATRGGCQCPQRGPPCRGPRSLCGPVVSGGPHWSQWADRGGLPPRTPWQLAGQRCRGNCCCGA